MAPGAQQWLGACRASGRRGSGKWQVAILGYCLTKQTRLQAGYGDGSSSLPFLPVRNVDNRTCRLRPLAGYHGLATAQPLGIGNAQRARGPPTSESRCAAARTVGHARRRGGLSQWRLGCNEGGDLVRAAQARSVASCEVRVACQASTTTNTRRLTAAGRCGVGAPSLEPCAFIQRATGSSRLWPPEAARRTQHGRACGVVWRDMGVAVSVLRPSKGRNDESSQQFATRSAIHRRS